jgi:hypothetical protein
VNQLNDKKIDNLLSEESEYDSHQSISVINKKKRISRKSSTSTIRTNKKTHPNFNFIHQEKLLPSTFSNLIEYEMPLHNNNNIEINKAITVRKRDTALIKDDSTGEILVMPLQKYQNKRISNNLNQNDYKYYEIDDGYKGKTVIKTIVLESSEKLSRHKGSVKNNIYFDIEPCVVQNINNFYWDNINEYKIRETKKALKGDENKEKVK